MDIATDAYPGVEVNLPRVEFFRPVPTVTDSSLGFIVPIQPFRQAVQGLQFGLKERFGATFCHRPRGTPEYLFIAQFHGMIRVWKEAENVVCPAGTVVIWPTGEVPQTYGVVDGMIEHSYCFLGGRAIHGLFKSWAKLRSPVILKHVDSSSFNLLIYMMIRESARSKPDPVLIENLAVMLAHLLQESEFAQPDNDSRQRLWMARQTLHLNLGMPHTVRSLALIAGMAPNHFINRFTDFFGSPPMTYLRTLRLQEAQNLLTTTNLPIKTIAQRVGYDDPLYFSRLFRQYLGLSPRLMRQRHWNLFESPDENKQSVLTRIDKNIMKKSGSS